MKIKNRGEELTQEERNEVANNLHITNHCKQRLNERVDVDVYKLIRNPMIAYFNTDGSMNFALDKWNYLVVARDDYHKCYNAVTWKELSWYGNDVYDKQRLAKAGYDRKENKKC